MMAIELLGVSISTCKSFLSSSCCVDGGGVTECLAGHLAASQGHHTTPAQYNATEAKRKFSFVI